MSQTDAELREQIIKIIDNRMSITGGDPDGVCVEVKDLNQVTGELTDFITARDAAKELDIEEHVNNLNIGHINSGMSIEDLRRVFEKRRVVIQLRRESDQAKEVSNGK